MWCVLVHRRCCAVLCTGAYLAAHALDSTVALRRHARIEVGELRVRQLGERGAGCQHVLAKEVCLETLHVDVHASETSVPAPGGRLALTGPHQLQEGVCLQRQRAFEWRQGAAKLEAEDGVQPMCSLQQACVLVLRRVDDCKPCGVGSVVSVAGRSCHSAYHVVSFSIFIQHICQSCQSACHVSHVSHAVAAAWQGPVNAGAGRCQKSTRKSTRKIPISWHWTQDSTYFQGKYVLTLTATFYQAKSALSA